MVLLDMSMTILARENSNIPTSYSYVLSVFVELLAASQTMTSWPCHISILIHGCCRLLFSSKACTSLKRIHIKPSRKVVHVFLGYVGDVLLEDNSKWGLSWTFQRHHQINHKDSPSCPTRSRSQLSDGYNSPWCLGSNAISKALPSKCLDWSVHVTFFQGLVLPWA